MGDSSDYRLCPSQFHPKAREKRSGDEVEREGISRHHRIYESHVHHFSLIKKQTEKVRVLGKK